MRRPGKGENRPGARENHFPLRKSRRGTGESRRGVRESRFPRRETRRELGESRRGSREGRWGSGESRRGSGETSRGTGECLRGRRETRSPSGENRRAPGENHRATRANGGAAVRIGSPTPRSFSREGITGYEIEASRLEVADTTIMLLLQSIDPLQERGTAGLRGLLLGCQPLVVFYGQNNHQIFPTAVDDCRALRRFPQSQSGKSGASGHSRPSIQHPPSTRVPW
jgi:hypothetical protein